MLAIQPHHWLTEEWEEEVLSVGDSRQGKERNALSPQTEKVEESQSWGEGKITLELPATVTDI